MMISGQEKICSRIDNATLDTFPRTLMLVGLRGSGKHMICDYVSKKFNLRLLDITEQLDLETIDEIYNRVEPYLYIIQANSITVKEENVILKFLEEPLKNAFIIMLTENENGLLQTIVNRCQIWHLQNYSKEFLSQFISEDKDVENILNIAKTPGQVVELCNINFTDAIELADKIISKINIASVSNTLTLSNKISFKKDETDKINVALFIDILLNRLVETYKINNNSALFQAYKLTSELSQLLTVKNLDQKALFEKYLLELRTIMRGSNSL